MTNSVLSNISNDSSIQLPRVSLVKSTQKVEDATERIKMLESGLLEWDQSEQSIKAITSPIKGIDRIVLIDNERQNHRSKVPNLKRE